MLDPFDCNKINLSDVIKLFSSQKACDAVRDVLHKSNFDLNIDSFNETTDLDKT